MSTSPETSDGPPVDMGALVQKLQERLARLRNPIVARAAIEWACSHTKTPPNA